MVMICWENIFWGYFFCNLIGTLIITWIIDIYLWKYYLKGIKLCPYLKIKYKQNKLKKYVKILFGINRTSAKGRRSLSLPVGIIERVLYTAAFITGVPAWIVVWMGIKTATTIKASKNEPQGSYNAFLIGSALSIMVGYIGAWAFLRRLPNLTH